ncbi:MAG: hypothetical protein ACI9R3_001831 [Verrucomicrobiales bacterium]|jgi:hypothetical protein
MKNIVGELRSPRKGYLIKYFTEIIDHFRGSGESLVPLKALLVSSDRDINEIGLSIASEVMNRKRGSDILDVIVPFLGDSNSHFRALSHNAVFATITKDHPATIYRYFQAFFDNAPENRRAVLLSFCMVEQEIVRAMREYDIWESVKILLPCPDKSMIQEFCASGEPFKEALAAASTYRFYMDQDPEFAEDIMGKMKNEDVLSQRSDMERICRYQLIRSRRRVKRDVG